MSNFERMLEQVFIWSCIAVFAFWIIEFVIAIVKGFKKPKMLQRPVYFPPTRPKKRCRCGCRY
jgi:hypothetical protein